MDISKTAEDARSAAKALLTDVVVDNAETPAEEKPAEAESPLETPVPENKPEEKKPEEKPKEELLKKSFDKLAQESAAIRKEKEELKAEKAELSKYKLLDSAVKNEDAMGALTLLGLKYSTLVKQLVGGKAPPTEDDEEESTSKKKDDPFGARVEALENIIKEERYQRSVEQLSLKIKEIAKTEESKFPLVNSDSDSIELVRKYLINFVEKSGKPPGDTIEESIQMALEAVEADQGKEADKWKKRLGLTDKKPSNSIEDVVAKSAVESAASELARKPKTLTNSHASAPRTVDSINPPEKTEDYRRKAVEILEKLG